MTDSPEALLRGPAADAFRHSPQLAALLERSGQPWVLAESIRNDAGAVIDFRISFINEEGAAVSGKARSELEGRTYEEVWPGIASQPFFQGYVAAVDRGQVSTRRFRYDNPELGADFDNHVVALGDGFALRFADVTDDVLKQERITAEQRLRAALDASLDGFLLLTPERDDAGSLHDFRIAYVNEAALHGANRSVSEVLGGRMGQVFVGTVASGQLQEYIEVSDTGTPLRRELDYSDAHVSSSFEVQAVPLEDGVAVSFRDTSHTVAQRRALEGSERRAREGERRAQEASARATLLADVTTALSEAVTAAEVADAIVTRVRGVVGADGVVVAQADEGTLHVLRCAGYDKDDSGYVEGMVLPAGHPLATVAVRREPAYAETAAGVRALLPPGAQVPEVSLDHAVAYLPLIVSGRPAGSMAIGFAEPHVFDEAERLLLGTLAGHCAQALERARLFQRQQHTALSLQRALLPNDLNDDPRMPIATRYLPAESGAEVGGDFYDIIPLPSGSIALVLGDVAGHNIAAAAVMGQVRNALRAYAIDGHSPAGVMERTNRLLAAVRQERLTTCAYVEICPEQASLTMVLAGHPPPVVRAPGQPAELLPATPGPPLGVDPEARFVERTYLLEPGALVLIYSDGLVESRHDQLDSGMDRLVAAAADLPDDPEAACDQILSQVAGAAGFDDIALLIARTATTATADRMTRDFPCDASSAPSARRFVGDVLTAWKLPALVETAELVISELCTNAVIHTSEDFRVGLRREGDERVRLEVVDCSDREPELPERNAVDDADALGGRGLHIVDALAEEWGVDSAPKGKCVYATLRV